MWGFANREESKNSNRRRWTVAIYSVTDCERGGLQAIDGRRSSSCRPSGN